MPYNRKRRTDVSAVPYSKLGAMRESTVSDLEALEHARNVVDAWSGNLAPSTLASRALSELDRLIDQARRMK